MFIFKSFILIFLYKSFRVVIAVCGYIEGIYLFFSMFES